MVQIYAGDDFQSLKDHIKRLQERGDDEAADMLRKHLAKLEAMKLQSELGPTKTAES